MTSAFDLPGAQGEQLLMTTSFPRTVTQLDRFHPDAVLATGLSAEEEPVLAVTEIQGNIVPGFGTAAATLLGLKWEPGATALVQARRWLRELAPRVSTLGQIHTLREVRRAVARATGFRPNLPDVLLNVAFAFPALAPLGLNADAIPDGCFVGGMARTDLQDPQVAGVPTGWVVGATPETTPDVLLVLGSDDPAVLAGAEAVLRAGLDGAGLRVIYRDEGRRLPNSIEHFGFRDDISQPGVRGRLSQRPDHVLTRRYFDPTDPRSRTHARPGQPLIWPGQFLFGYATQVDADPEVAGPESRPSHEWMRHGSFLAFRRLRQDVAAFRQFAATQAVSATAHLGRPVSAAELQAWIVGRWPDGSPLARSPEAPDPKTAADDMAVNFFGILEDEPDATVLQDSVRRQVAGAPGDRTGVHCPHFAHVRKVNLRDKPTDQGSSLRFRILRRGIPYGPLYAEGERPGTDRGLLFLSYQRSLDVQFLTLNATWMNTAGAPEGFGHDLLVGQNQDHPRSAERLFADGKSLHLEAPRGAAWVIPTGGGFFFSPAVSVLAGL
jgi:Dyp-type peroxidase family